MFYWKQKTEIGTTLEEELLSCVAVNKVVMASAFLSREGIRILQRIKEDYSLEKESITLYISSRFSDDKPHEILKQLSALCVTKIIFDHGFHAKVYLLRGNSDKIVFGSSNFTGGGMMNNIEFDFIGSPSSDDINAVTAFFDYCNLNATEVTNEVIKYYEDNQANIADLQRTRKKLTSILTGFTHQDDAFLPGYYDLDGYYFGYSDYETFFVRNRKKIGADIQAKRKSVQSKMLAIHQDVYPEISKLGIAHHKRKENITSLITPHPINFGSVGWLGVRYGKTPKEVDILNAGKEKDDDTYGFQKHGCLQFSIGEDGFEINLFLAVRHGAIDRLYLHQNLKKFKTKIESELSKLKGHGMEWVVWDNISDESFAFDIDTDDITTFCDFFKNNDIDGCESYLRKFYKPDDDILRTKDTIDKEIVSMMKILLPLYNTIVWRPNV